MKSIILSLLVAVSLAACTDYGKKVTIEGTKGEVYYKGNGVTEADAKKVCTYLKDVIKYFDADKRQSVQLTKSKGDGYDVRFVVDEKKLKESPKAADAFAQIGAAMSVDLFDNKPVNVFLTDTHFKDLKSIPFDEEVVKKLKEKMNPPPTEEKNIQSDSKENPNQ
jgi:hypothetical protein